MCLSQGHSSLATFSATPLPAPGPAVVRGGLTGEPRSLRVATCLAPGLEWLYRRIVGGLAERVGLPMELVVPTDYAGWTDHDLAFICSLPYIEQGAHSPWPADRPMDVIAAPVLRGERYGGRPIYFSDVVVRHDHPAACFADLRGAAWGYNEPWSQSGYGITRWHLARIGETHGFFGHVTQSGSHENAMRQIVAGEIDAAAIDSHVLAAEARREPALVSQLRVIDTLGPSTIQPLCVNRRLPARLRQRLTDAVTGLHTDAQMRTALTAGHIDRFVPLVDAAYDDIRAMVDRCASVDFMALR